jgi:hypothetical protein
VFDRGKIQPYIQLPLRMGTAYRYRGWQRTWWLKGFQRLNEIREGDFTEEIESNGMTPL